MHVYGADEDRKTAIFLLAAFSIVIAYAISSLLVYIGITPKWWIDMPGPIAVFGVLYVWFDNWGWRTGVVRLLRLVTIPDLAGRWKAETKSSHDDFQQIYQADVRIKQSWTKISVVLDRESSQSYSVSATISVNSAAMPRLSYLYINEPKPGSANSMNIHYGSVSVSLHEDGGRWEGEYFTGRGRSTHGSLVLKRSADRTTASTPHVPQSS